jgi:hypothetical protein
MEKILDVVFLRNKKINFIKSDTCIGSVFRSNNYWEIWMLDYFIKYYKPNTNMIDLGGNIGSSSLLMSEILTPNNNIYVFEPIYFNILNKNIQDNKKEKDIILFPYGVGNCDKQIFIPKIDLTNNDNFGAKSIVGFGDNIVNEDDIIINIKKLDSFDFENISLMKIDVENMEIEVLEGAINLINKCKPVIIIETYQYDNFINSDIFKALQTIGYNIHIIPEGHNDFIMKIDE